MRKLADSFKYARDGIKKAFVDERNFRIHCVAAVLVVILGIILGLSLVEFAVIIFVTGFVLAAELINTAIENTVNMITREYSEEAKLIKDISAGFVLIAAVTAAFVGVFIFVGSFFRLIGE
jgi:undecaprenol kinase